MPWLEGIGGLAVLVVAFVLWGRWERRRWRRALGNGTYAARFVDIRDDGSAWELEPDQIEHLSAEYQGADGARPYIKSRYDSRTPDGRIGGYLLRTKLPAALRVKAIAEAQSVRSAEQAADIAIPAFVAWLGPNGATPDRPPTASLDAGVWRVVADWNEAGGGLFVDVSEASGRVLTYGVTSTPRHFTIPLGAKEARVHAHYVNATDS